MQMTHRHDVYFSPHSTEAHNLVMQIADSCNKRGIWYKVYESTLGIGIEYGSNVAYVIESDRKTEQTDCYVSDLCKHYGDKQICGRCRSRNLFCEAEPQPRCPKCGKRGYIRSLESMGVKLNVFDEYRWKCTNCNNYFKEEPKTESQTEYEKYREKIRPHDPHKDWFEDEPQTERSE